MKTMIAAIVLAGAALGLIPVASAHADDGIDPSCERVAILGLDPHVRTICDTPIWPDGSWDRYRKLDYLQSTKSSCGGNYYQGGNCPPWMQKDVVPERVVKDSYRVTADTIPPGEPGHLG